MFPGTSRPLFASRLAQPPGWEIFIIEPIVTKIGSFQDQCLLRKREKGPGIILTLSRISSPAPVFGSKISDPYRKSLVWSMGMGPSARCGARVSVLFPRKQTEPK